MDIVLAAHPSEYHFDPEEMRLTVVDPFRGVDELTIEHPWFGGQAYRACAGHLVIADRHDKHLILFTFGGDVHIESQGEFSLIGLETPAPILLQSGAPTELALLIEEAEILLAQRRAARQEEPGLFDRHLSAAPPLELYLAMLVAMREKYTHLHFGEDEPVTKFKHLLKVEIEALQETIPGMLEYTLEELL